MRGEGSGVLSPMAPSGRHAPLLETHGLVKRFGTLVANDRVDLAVRAGEIQALLGENGAGKSTLVKMLYGLLQPDAGHILWEGRRTVIAAPRYARQLGIGMVFQHFSLFEAMTVAENIALGLDGSRRDTRALGTRIHEVAEKYGLALDPGRHVYDLSVGERQRIEIVRCLLQAPRLLIMDEPTAVLTPQETERLFATLQQLAHEGCAILYISHKLEEIRTLCDQRHDHARWQGGHGLRPEGHNRAWPRSAHDRIGVSHHDAACAPGQVAARSGSQ